MKRQTSILFVILCSIIILGCAEEEKKEKIDLQKIKESRSELDYKEKMPENKSTADLFKKLNDLLTEWQTAQAQLDNYVFEIEKELYDLSRGHFSELVKALQGENAYIAAAALGFSEDMRAIPYLLEVLEKGNAEAKNNAAMAIGHIGSDQTPMEPLFKHLHEDPDEDVRSMIAFAIAQIVRKEKDEGSLPELLKAIKDPSPLVRANVILALDKIENPEGHKAIMASTIDDENPIVRYNSVRSLGKVPKKEAIPHLIAKLRDSFADIRQKSYELLKKMTGKDFGEDIAKWEEWAGIKPQASTPQASTPQTSTPQAGTPQTSN